MSLIFRAYLLMAALLLSLPLLGVSQCNQSVDADGDGYTSDVDCNDSDPTINPGAQEPCACDGIDQNCNGQTDDFPCDMACTYQQEGELCGGDHGTCDSGLVCCYPCGIYGCDNVCMKPCFDDYCSGGCPMYP